MIWVSRGSLRRSCFETDKYEVSSILEASILIFEKSTTIHNQFYTRKTYIFNLRYRDNLKETSWFFTIQLRSFWIFVSDIGPFYINEEHTHTHTLLSTLLNLIGSQTQKRFTFSLFFTNGKAVGMYDYSAY